MIRGVHHTAISTGNMEKALAFYRDLLGFTTVFDFRWHKGSEVSDLITQLKNTAARVVMLKAGNTFLELFEYVTPRPKRAHPHRPVCDHGITHVCLDVTNIDAEYTRLKSAGMVFHCPPQTLGPGLRMTYGRDPDGNVIELQELRKTKKLKAMRQNSRRSAN